LYKQNIQAKLHNHFSLEHVIIQSVILIRAEVDLLSLFNYVKLLSWVKLFNFFSVNERWLVQITQLIKCRM